MYRRCTLVESLLTMYRLCTLVESLLTISVCLLSENEQKLRTKSLSIKTTSFVLPVSNPPTTTLKRWPNRRQQKALKAERALIYMAKSCLVSFRRATCNCGRSYNVNYPRRPSTQWYSRKNVAITKFLSRKFSIMGFSAISRKF